MIIFLRCFFAVVLVSMLAMTGWASTQCSLFAIPREVGSHPWFIATLLDAYWGFLTFYCWVAWKETSWLSRILWLVAILLLGNIAMAIYALIQLFKVPTTATLQEALTLRKHA